MAEAFPPCGLGAEIAAQVADAGFNDLDAPIRRLNGAFAPVPYSPPLEKALVPDVAYIVLLAEGESAPRHQVSDARTVPGWRFPEIGV